MDHSDAWQMSIGTPTPEQVAIKLGSKTPSAFVDEAIAECASACSGEQTEEEIREALDEHRDWMVEQIEEAKQALPTRAEQAVDGLDVTAAGGVVLVEDGHTKWLCPEERYDAAYAALESLAPVKGDGGDADAYSELCRRVGAGGVVAAMDGGCDHGTANERHALVRRALDAELIDAATAQRMGLPQ